MTDMRAIRRIIAKPKAAGPLIEYQPSQEVIAEECRKIRDGWGDYKRYRRSLGRDHEAGIRAGVRHVRVAVEDIAALRTEM